MSERRRLDKAGRPVTVVLGLALIAAAGFCSFDGHGSDDGVARDLCARMLATTVVMVLMVCGLAIGRAPIAIAPLRLLVPVRILDPPPRLPHA
jgi:hypothetical protein